MGTPRVHPCVPRPVQLRHECSLTGEAYVARSAWRDASLAACPRHPRGGCGLVRHGTYARRTPVGMRIARYYCPTARETFSLLPDCLASHFPGALDAIEHVVATVETARSVEAAADVLRPEITLPAAVRWIRRRLTPARRALLAVVTLLPDLFTGDARLSAVRLALPRRLRWSRCGPTPPATWRRCPRRSDSTPAHPDETCGARRSHTAWGQTAPGHRGEDPARRAAAAKEDRCPHPIPRRRPTPWPCFGMG